MPRLAVTRTRDRRVGRPSQVTVRLIGCGSAAVEGQCDYVDRRSATGYLDAFPGSRLVHIQGAGHDVHVDEPIQVVEPVRSSVADRPVPEALADPHQPPPGYQPRHSPESERETRWSK